MAIESQNFKLEVVKDYSNIGPKVSLRGVSADESGNFWASGSEGQVFHISNGKLQNVAPVGYDSTDFRVVSCLSPGKTLLLSAGSPALILLTKDYGENWQEVYRDERAAIFFDGMVRLQNCLLAFGDPIDGKLQLIKSEDLGKNWEDISFELPAEAGKVHGYAASGSGIAGMGTNLLWIGLGGETSPVLHSTDAGANWQLQNTPMAAGGEMQGIYSLGFQDANNGVAVGGEWKVEDQPGTRAFTRDGGKTWSVGTGVDAYRSSVISLGKDTFLASGISGTDLSTDGGKTWKTISQQGYQALQVLPNSSNFFGVGKDGLIHLLSLTSASARN